jgi:GH15 family glucan-1,4-alpha-glucosidase
MCWAALDRGIMLASTFAVEAPLSEWVKTRQEIADAILNEGYDAKLGAFIQAFDCSDLDASALIIPRLGFLSGSDARVVSTIGLLQKKLTHNGLVYRYRGKDGLPGSENTFSLCSYWMVDALALSGQLREAHDLFEFIYSFANDLGLLSEEIDPVGHLLIGNFPQGFTHMALINSAVNLAKITKHGPEIKPENEAQRAGNAATAAAEGYARS